MVPVPIGGKKAKLRLIKKTTVNSVQLVLLHPNLQLLRDFEMREKFCSSNQKSINLAARWGSNAQTVDDLGAKDRDFSRENRAGGWQGR